MAKKRKTIKKPDPMFEPWEEAFLVILFLGIASLAAFFLLALAAGNF